QREKSTAKVKRKYHSDYIQFMLFWTGEEEDPKPHCVLCYETLANEAMKPAKLKRHLETKHKEYQGKPIGFFETKRDEPRKHDERDLPASYKVSLLIAKAGKPHSIAENLVDTFMPLDCMMNFSFVVPYQPTQQEKITWTGQDVSGFAPTRAVAPSAASTHCCIHREQLAVKKMPQCLKSVLDESVKIVNKIKAKPLNSRLFKAVCEEMGSEHTKLLFHTEVRWLSCGKVLTRLFELRDEVMLFLHHSDELYDRMHDFQWLAKLPYLADIFSTLNTLNVALQGKTVTIFNVQDKIKATRLKMELWCGRLDRREFDSFPTLADFLLQFTSKLSPREVDSLVDIASDGTLKTTFREKGLTDFWLHIQPEHPQLADSTLKLLMPFPNTYNCEVGFSTLVGLKTKQRNRISVDYKMRLKLSSLEPDIASLVAQKKQHHSSH
uniref:BED-type domain-containing protein n=1 Tax=Oryzias latipes TaxID=8090 RepID=A0A3P9KVF1_ORYLA